MVFAVVVDKNECKTKEFQCKPNEICINTVGAYECACAEGYKADEDGTCQGIKYYCIDNHH